MFCLFGHGPWQIKWKMKGNFCSWKERNKVHRCFIGSGSRSNMRSAQLVAGTSSRHSSPFDSHKTARLGGHTMWQPSFSTNVTCLSGFRVESRSWQQNTVFRVSQRSSGVESPQAKGRKCLVLGLVAQRELTTSWGQGSTGDFVFFFFSLHTNWVVAWYSILCVLYWGKLSLQKVTVISKR